MLSISSVCPLISPFNLSELISHNFIVSSLLADAINFPSELISTDVTVSV